MEEDIIMKRRSKWDEFMRPDGVRTQCHICGKMVDGHLGQWHIEFLLHLKTHGIVSAEPKDI